VVNAQLTDGILTVELKRDVPETMKPRRIELSSSGTQQPNKQIESKAA
jgi:molecular chaperone IbpA